MYEVEQFDTSNIFEVPLGDFVSEKHVPLPPWKLGSQGILGGCGNQELVPLMSQQPDTPNL